MSLSFHTAPGQMLYPHTFHTLQPFVTQGRRQPCPAWVLWLLPSPFLPFGQGNACLGFQGWAGSGAFFLPRLPWQMPFPAVLLGSLGQQPPTKGGHKPLGLAYTAYWGRRLATGPELCQASATFSSPCLTLVTGRSPGIARCCAMGWGSGCWGVGWGQSRCRDTNPAI